MDGEFQFSGKLAEGQSAHNVNALFFSVLREAVGAEAVEWPWREGLRLEDLKRDVLQKWPALARYESGLLMAVNQEMVSGGTELFEGDEIAFMPPFQGG